MTEARIEVLTRVAKVASGRVLTTRLVQAHKLGKIRVVSTSVSGRAIAIRVKPDKCAA